MRILGMLLLLCTACGDLGPLRTVGPSPTGPSLYVGDIPPDTAGGPEPGGSSYGDPEPRWPVNIRSTSLKGSLPGAYPNYLSVVGDMTYDAYHAAITLALDISGPDATHQEVGPIEKHTFWSFFSNNHFASFTQYIR